MISSDSGEALVRENCGSPNSGGSPMRLKTDSSEENYPRHPRPYPHTCPLSPVFLRDVGKYYWNTKTLFREYKKPWLCMPNMYTKMFRFLKDETLLYLACQNGYLKTLEFLLKKGGKISWNMLFLASQTGKLEIVRFLAENSDVIHGGCTTSICPSMHAIRVGDLDTLKFFVENKICAHIDKLLKTACVNEELDMVKFLMINGPSPDGIVSCLAYARRTAYRDLEKCLEKK
jgi:ankyrin repeat protein